MNDKKVIYGLLIASVILFLGFGIAKLGVNIIVDQTTNAVIEKLQRYTPGPYNPAFDPDKVDPNLWNNKQTNNGSSWQGEWTSLRDQ